MTETSDGMIWVEVLEPRQLLSSAPTEGLTPQQVRHAYGFDQITFRYHKRNVVADGSYQTIAIVGAFHTPTIQKDLAVFSKQFGLPMTDAYGKPVLTVATPQGVPKTDGGWASENTLDVEWAHAIAPKAHILLVEAKSDFTDDLVDAIDYARRQPGVVVVSLSWGADGPAPSAADEAILRTPPKHIGGGGKRGGVTFVASSGDDGPFLSWPANSKNVIDVGGTSLSTTKQGTWVSETAWPTSINALRARRQGTTTPTVSYNADPEAGFAVYDSTPDEDGVKGWSVIGGTSAGVPQWAALVAIADQGRMFQGKGSLYSEQALPAIFAMPASNFHDIVTGGSNGYFAHAGTDILTGRGSPFADKVIWSLASA